MHIAILMANTDESDFAQGHPKDGEKFTRLLAPLRPDWQFSVVTVKDGEFPEDLSAYDGFIITGSPASVHDADPWVDRLMDVIRQIRSENRPVFGACFGHQAIAKALGGRVDRNPGGWVFGLEETVLEGEPIRLYAAHVEQVTALPAGAKSLGGNAGCPNGAFQIGTRVLTSQYHPEITPQFAAALVEEYADKLPPAVALRAKESLAETADSARIADRIIRFFESA
jgi:GMP synthase-like glutamine amidotransferase